MSSEDIYDEYYAILVNSEEDAKMLLNLYINYVKSQAKTGGKKNKEYKYRDRYGNPKIPIELRLRKLSREYPEHYTEELITMDYNTKKAKGSPYVPIKDRIPGQIYKGKKFEIKNDHVNTVLKQNNLIQEIASN